MTPDRTATSRVLLKLSGEAFGGEGGWGIDTQELRTIAGEIALAHAAGGQIAVVVGGGNVIRGAQLAKEGLVHRAIADEMGMLGTVINALALREALASLGITAHCMSAVHITAIAEPFVRRRAVRYLETGSIVVLGGGVGSPFFTTDTTAALRATELGCSAVLKATKVDGVYTADPKKDKTARRYDSLSFTEATEKKLAIMDMTALAMCQEQNLPVIVFDYKTPGNIKRAVTGQPVGTLIKNS